MRCLADSDQLQFGVSVKSRTPRLFQILPISDTKYSLQSLFVTCSGKRDHLEKQYSMLKLHALYRQLLLLQVYIVFVQIQTRSGIHYTTKYSTYNILYTKIKNVPQYGPFSRSRSHLVHVLTGKRKSHTSIKQMVYCCHSLIS